MLFSYQRARNQTFCHAVWNVQAASRILLIVSGEDHSSVQRCTITELCKMCLDWSHGSPLSYENLIFSKSQPLWFQDYQSIHGHLGCETCSHILSCANFSSRWKQRYDLTEVHIGAKYVFWYNLLFLRGLSWSFPQAPTVCVIWLFFPRSWPNNRWHMRQNYRLHTAE